MDMDNSKGLLGIPPEYVHILINPLPTYGVLIGICVLLVRSLSAMIFRIPESGMRLSPWTAGGIDEMTALEVPA